MPPATPSKPVYQEGAYLKKYPITHEQLVQASRFGSTEDHKSSANMLLGVTDQMVRNEGGKNGGVSTHSNIELRPEEDTIPDRAVTVELRHANGGIIHGINISSVMIKFRDMKILENATKYMLDPIITGVSKKLSTEEFKALQSSMAWAETALRKIRADRVYWNRDPEESKTFSDTADYEEMKDKSLAKYAPSTEIRKMLDVILAQQATLDHAALKVGINGTTPEGSTFQNPIMYIGHDKNKTVFSAMLAEAGDAVSMYKFLEKVELPNSPFNRTAGASPKNSTISTMVKRDWSSGYSPEVIAKMKALDPEGKHFGRIIMLADIEANHPNKKYYSQHDSFAKMFKHLLQHSSNSTNSTNSTIVKQDPKADDIMKTVYLEYKDFTKIFPDPSLASKNGDPGVKMVRSVSPSKSHPTAATTTAIRPPFPANNTLIPANTTWHKTQTLATGKSGKSGKPMTSEDLAAIIIALSATKGASTAGSNATTLAGNNTTTIGKWNSTKPVSDKTNSTKLANKNITMPRNPTTGKAMTSEDLAAIIIALSAIKSASTAGSNATTLAGNKNTTTLNESNSTSKASKARKASKAPKKHIPSNLESRSLPLSDLSSSDLTTQLTLTDPPTLAAMPVYTPLTPFSANPCLLRATPGFAQGFAAAGRFPGEYCLVAFLVVLGFGVWVYGRVVGYGSRDLGVCKDLGMCKCGNACACGDACQCAGEGEMLLKEKMGEDEFRLALGLGCGQGTMRDGVHGFLSRRELV